MDISEAKAAKIIGFLRQSLTQIADPELRAAIERDDAQAAYDRLERLKEERMAGSMTGDHFLAPILANAVKFILND